MTGNRQHAHANALSLQADQYDLLGGPQHQQYLWWTVARLPYETKIECEIQELL